MIEKSTATFDTKRKSIDEMKNWFIQHGSDYPIIVAIRDDDVIGWASLSRYSTRCAYSKTVELSVYVHEEYQRQGYGKSLFREIISSGKDFGFHAIISRIVDGNEQSIHLHEKFGFSHVGVLKEVGYKFETIHDVYLMQYIFD